MSRIKRETEGRLSIDFFKIDANLEIVLSFFMNPTLYTCSSAVTMLAMMSDSDSISAPRLQWTTRMQSHLKKVHTIPKPTTFRQFFYQMNGKGVKEEIFDGETFTKNLKTNSLGVRGGGNSEQ